MTAALIPITRTAVVVAPDRGIVRNGAVLALLRADCPACQSAPCWVHCSPQIYTAKTDGLGTIQRCQECVAIAATKARAAMAKAKTAAAVAATKPQKKAA